MSKCKACHGNKVYYPLGGLPKDCLSCNGLGYIVFKNAIDVKKKPAEALEYKLMKLRNGQELGKE